MARMTASPPADAVARASATFRARFGRAPAHLVAAPGRVNLIGEHTDYNDGFVLPMAIERDTAIAAAPVDGTVATVFSAGLRESATVDLAQPLEPSRPAWTNYIRGVIAGFQREGITVPAFQAVIESDVPPGGGLASSAALEVAAATFFEALCRRSLDPSRKARLCQRAEHEFAGVPSGIMDQLTSVTAVAGHALLIDCRSFAVTPVPMADSSIAILIVNTQVRHDLASGEYARRRAECEEAARFLGVPALRDATLASLTSSRTGLDATLVTRARHVISENQRTVDAAAALTAGDWSRMGSLMYASHASLRDDYEVSCRELDAVVEIAAGIGEAEGIYGCRMTGGGFGGSAVCLVKSDAVIAAGDAISRDYERRIGHAPELFVSRPGPGARILC